MAVDEDEPATFLLPKSFQPEPSSAGRFKGVALNQYGNWAPQIHPRDSKIAFGTFKSELSSAAKLNSASLSPPKSAFQNLHSPQSLLSMISDGSYEPKLAEFRRSNSTADYLRELFRKELTPSDVGKLNRLVIPKKHAVKFFPNVVNMASGEEGNAVEGVMLEFKDLEERRWEFRYCYWKSSQSFVFTKGWNKFVKTNQLRSKDVVTFYGGEERDGVPSFFLIEASRHSQLLEEPVLRSFLSSGGEKEEETTTPKKAFRLFGVQIDDR